METAIYGRVSTEEQALEGFSIRGQVEKLQSYVSAKSWSIYDVYLDEGISGKNLTARPAVNRMIADIKAGHVKNVLIYKLDRLTRSVADLVYLIDLFKEYGCAFNSLSESIDTSTASGRMFVKIIGIFAEFERENIAERVRMGKERKAKEGYTVSGAISSYGFQRKLGENVQTIDPKEAAIVRRIFDMYVNQNMSLNGIAKTLNKENIPTKYGRTWNSGTVVTLLSNPNHIGSVRYCMDDPERYFEAEGKHEAIISEELYREAQILIERNKAVAPTKRPAEKNYFAGFLHCGLCGSKLASHNTVQSTKQGERLKTVGFECQQRQMQACKAKVLTAKKFEREFIAYFNRIEHTAQDEEKENQERLATLARIEELKEKITSLDKKEQEMLDSYIEDGATLAEYRAVKTKLDGERAGMRAEIEKLKPSEVCNHQGMMTREEIISSIRRNWETFSDKEKRQFLVRHIKKIVVINHPVPGKRHGIYEILEVEYNT